MAIWVPVYWLESGPANFLWLCDVANFVVLAGLWLESPLLLSSQAVSVLIIQTAWCIDWLGRLALGRHLLGGTEYMFDPAEALAVKLLSTFHLWMPLLLLWTVWRVGYHRYGWRFQTVVACIVLPLSTLPDPARNLNWVWRPFALEQRWLPSWAWVALCLALYPLVLYLPTHLALLTWARKRRRPIHP
jgi:hypothetical protein